MSAGRRKWLRGSGLAVLFLAVTPTCFAQRVNANHFNDGNSKPVAPSPVELQAPLREAHAHLLGYKAQLKGKSGSVEEARQEAISAGIQGDGAGSYLEAYEQQRKELQPVQKSLSAKIEESQNTINGLQAHVTLVATKTDSSQPRYHRRQISKTRIVAQETMRQRQWR